MLSYQHAYHAGNPADVHKHLALVLLLGHLRQKAAPFCFVDSHAGRGLYDLAGPEAQKTGEAAAGILKLLALADAPAPLAAYLDRIVAANGAVVEGARRVSTAVPSDAARGAARQPRSAAGMRWYPGSAALAAAMLRDQDRAILLELHPQEQAALKRALGGDRRIAIHVRDCFEGLPALLPPAIRRGLVLIDPSYEERDEYARVASLLGRALERWGNAIVLLWYPLLADARERALERGLAALELPKAVVSEFRFSTDAIGLQGSGLVIVNAPWRFAESFAAAMEHVVRALCPGIGRHRIVEHEPA